MFGRSVNGRWSVDQWPVGWWSVDLIKPEYSPGPHIYRAFHFSNSFSRNFTYDRHRISFLKLPEGVHHIIYTVSWSKCANAKQLRTIYFSLCSIRLICNNSTLLQNYAKFQKYSVVICMLFHYPFNA